MSEKTVSEPSIQPDADPFPSTVALRATHSRLLKRFRNNDHPADFWDEVASFIRRGQATGKLIKEDSDRWDTQSSLDYWATLMLRANLDPPDATLAEFDVTLSPELDESQCPYVGLRAFDEAQQQFFFGRQRLVGEIIEGLKERRWLVITGPSGSGKSSLALAGVLPALKEGKVPGSENWHYCPPIVPGSLPLVSLASLVRPPGTHSADWEQQQIKGFYQSNKHLLQLINGAYTTPTVIICDQFEEIFTLTSDEPTRKAFIDNLLSVADYPDLRHTVIITMRSDFEEYLTNLPELKSHCSANTLHIGRLGAAELRDAIEKPAEFVGLKFEEGIVDKLINEVLGEPAGLPLLQFTLLKLWKMRRHNLVTWEAFRELGSCREALTNTAKTFYKQLLPKDRQRVKRILLQLVRWGDGLEVSSDRLPRAAFSSPDEDPKQTEEMLDELVHAGLLRQSRPDISGMVQVEVSHDSLIRYWPKLVEWLDDARINKRQHLRLSEAAKQWDTLKKDPNALLRGSLLEEALRIKGLTPLESSFVEKSRKREQLRKRIISLSIILTIAILGITTLFYRVQRNQARKASLKARSRVLAYQALNNLNNQLDLALLLSIEAYKTEKTVEARSSLLYSIGYSPQITGFLYGHQARVKSIAFSPDGKLLASGGVGRNKLYLWDVEKRSALGDRPLLSVQEVVSSGGQESSDAWTINAVVFNQDGRLLASGHKDGTIMVWDTAQRKVLAQMLPEQESPVTSLAFGQQDQSLISGHLDGSVISWDVQKQQPVVSFTAKELNPTDEAPPAEIEDLVISAGGERVACLLEDMTFTVWNVKARRQLGKNIPVPDFYREVDLLSFSPDGKILAIGGKSTLGAESSISMLKDDISFLTLWEIGNRTRQIGNRINADGSVTNMTFTRDNRTLAACNSSGTINLWRVDENLQPLNTFPTGHTELRSIAFNASGNSLAAGSASGIITLFDIMTPQGIKNTFPEQRMPVVLAFSPDGQRLASRETSPSGIPYSRNNPIVLWDIKKNKVEIPLTDINVFSLAFSPDSQMLAWGGDKRSINICNVVTDVQCSQKKVLNISTPGEAATEGGPRVKVESLAFSPDGKTLASFANVGAEQSKPNPIILWDVSSGKSIGQLQGHMDSLKSLAFSPDGKLLASGGAGTNKLYLWDVEKRSALGGKPLLSVQDTGPSGMQDSEAASTVNAVAFNQDGTLLASGSDDGAIIIWDVATFQPLGELTGTRYSSIYSLSFSRKESGLLVSGGSDKTINIWDVETWQQLGQLKGHNESVRYVIFNRQDDFLASGGDDGAIIVWDFNIDSWQKIASKTANRVLSDDEQRFFLKRDY